MMDSLDIPATVRTPEVSFNFRENRLGLVGESYPEDVTRFYNPLFDALDTYLNSLSSGHCRFDFKLVYFNSSSAKAIMMIMDKLDEAAYRGNQINVHWFYDPEDDTMEELGEEFGQDLQSATFKLEKMTV